MKTRSAVIGAVTIGTVAAAAILATVSTQNELALFAQDPPPGVAARMGFRNRPSPTGFLLTFDLPPDTINGEATIDLKRYLKATDSQGRPFTSPNFEIQTSNFDVGRPDQVLRWVHTRKSGWLAIQVSWRGATRVDSVFVNCSALVLVAEAFGVKNAQGVVDTIFAVKDPIVAPGDTVQFETICISQSTKVIQIVDTTYVAALAALEFRAAMYGNTPERIVRYRPQ